MMHLIEVSTPADQQEFLLLPVRLYAHDTNWIRPLDQDIEQVFNPKKNKNFKHGEAVRWILQDAERQTIGRVAAFFSTEQKEDQPTGGMGFFECIENQEAAFILFDACQNWLQNKGMEAMDGPINFGDRTDWWGLMVKGWEQEPTYKMPWTKPYYIPFFEAYGFQDYFQQYVYQSPIVNCNVDKSVMDKAQRIYEGGQYDFRHIEVKKLAKYGEDFRTIFNAAWAKFPGQRELTSEQAQNLVKQMKPIIDEQILWFAYDNQNNPVAFFIVIPDINQIVKHLDGKFNLWAKLKFLMLKWRGAMTRSVGVVFGVVPDHQGRGLESAIALYLVKAARENPFYPYETMDLNWVGDFNPKMMRFCSTLGTTIPKKYITYRYLFDRTKEFKRCPRVG